MTTSVSLLVWVYWVSLAVVIGAAVIVSFGVGFDSGFMRIFWLGGVAMFGVAGFDFTPQTWLVGFMTCLAGACVGAATRHLRHMRGDHVDCDDHQAHP